jgi:E3 ubiquitin-protein ligase SHPRH
MTTVFMYLVGDTVEEAIYDISVARRLEHMGRSSSNSGFGSALDSKPVSGTTTPAPVPAPVLKLQEQTIEQANSMELEAAPLKQLLRKKGDGEIVQVNDLWSCLFGKVRKPLNERKSKVLDEEVGRHLRAQAAERRILEGEMGGEMDGEGGVEVEGGGVLV